MGRMILALAVVAGLCACAPDAALAAGKPLTIQFSPLTAIVTEGQTAHFMLAKSGGNGRVTAVKITTSDGSYSATITAGSAVPVPTRDNSIVDGTRHIVINALASTGAKATATLDVLDNDVVPVPPANPTWSYCASDPGTCKIIGTADVRYGVNNLWIVKPVTGSITCGGLATWGYDPAQGMFKHCETDGQPDVAPADPNCLKPMTYQGVTACTEINFAKPPVEETDIPDAISLDAGTMPSGGGALNQYVPDDTVGAWRVFGKVSWVGRADPLVHFGEPGAGHLHTGICNSLPNGASTDYTLLRTTGTSTCGLLAGVGIWMPSMIDVVQQVVKQPKKVYYYYKQLPPGHPGCTDPVKRRGICIDLPLGHKWAFGYRMATMSGGLTDPNSFDYWLQGFFCGSDDPAIQAKITATGKYQTLKALADAGCPVGATLAIVFWGPDCSDGRIDSPDHQSHVSYATGPDLGYGRVCQPPYNYIMPEMQFNWQWTVTSDLHNWCLSSDLDMQAKGMNVACGTTLHMDYWNGWSKAVRDAWEQCIRRWLSCANGDLANGRALIGADAGGVFPETTDIPLSQLQGGTIYRP